MARTKPSKGPKAETAAPSAAVEPAAERTPIDLALEAVARGTMTMTQAAMVGWGLEERHILASREYPQADRSVEVAILTQGGQRIRWPQDAGRVLSDMEKGDGKPVPVPAGIFSR